MARQVHLVPIDPELARALDAEPAGLLLRYRVTLGESGAIVRDVVRSTLAMPDAAPPWGGYLGFDERSRLAVGTCAFKRRPGPDGSVEIAYFTFPGFEGLGYATAMAARLLEIGWASGDVVRIVAHTLPSENASTRILEKLGFSREGVVEDPEEGTVWRWSRPRPGALRPTPPLPAPA